MTAELCDSASRWLFSNKFSVFEHWPKWAISIFGIPSVVKISDTATVEDFLKRAQVYSSIREFKNAIKQKELLAISGTRISESILAAPFTEHWTLSESGLAMVVIGKKRIVKLYEVQWEKE